MIRFALALLGLLSLSSAALAGYPTCSSYGCSTSYGYSYGPSYSYSYSYAPTYSAWSYWVYPGTEYFYRVRYRYENGYRYLEDDGNLYVRYWHGGAWCYNRHCAIADYVAKPAVVLKPAAQLAIIGTAEYGYDPLQYAAAKVYGPAVAGIIPPQGAPSPVDVASLLPPVTTERPARLEAAVKQHSSATETLKQIALNDQAHEQKELDARRQLALQANKLQAFERMLGKFNEMAAIADQTATISSEHAASQIAVGDPALAKVIAENCLSCHGGSKTDAGLDFKLAGSFDEAKWRKINRAVASGSMPKGGKPLDDSQLALFEDQLYRVRRAAAN